jgi:hypothetical protein
LDQLFLTSDIESMKRIHSVKFATYKKIGKKVVRNILKIFGIQKNVDILEKMGF